MSEPTPTKEPEAGKPANASAKLAGIPGLTVRPARTGRAFVIGGQKPPAPVDEPFED